MLKDSNFSNQALPNDQPAIELPKILKPEEEALISDIRNNDIEDAQLDQKNNSEDNIENKTEDKIKQKLQDFLIAEGVIMEKDGRTIVDLNKLNDNKFKNNLSNLTLKISRKDHVHIKGSLKLISEKFGDLDAISLADYEKEKQESLKAEPSKLLFIKQIFKGTNKEKILHIMEQEKVLEEIDGYRVIDIEKFSVPGFINKNIRNHRYTRNRQVVSGGQKLVFEELADLPVVSRDEFMEARQKGYAIKPKPLFNVPASLDEALDIAEARKKNYYLNFWDMGPSRKQQTPWRISLKLKNGDEIGVSEWGLFTKIFVDHQGERDDDGKIKVFDEKKQNFVRASADWIDTNIGGVGGGKNNGFENHPQGFLLDKCPNLIKKGLIKIEDFKIITNSRSGYLLRKEFPMSKTSHNIMINSVAYYIGRDKFKYENFSLPMENVKIAVLDNNIVGIIKVNKGREQLLFTLGLLDEEEKEKKRQEIISKRKDMPSKDITSNTVVGNKEVKERIRPYRPTRDNPIRQGETAENYAERIRYLGDYENLKEISDDFSKQCLIGIHNLTWREQQWLCGAAYDLGYKDYHRLLEFGKNYGLAGLKTFLSCEHNINNSGKILFLGDQLQNSPEAADLLFTEYAQLVDKTEQTAEEMSRLYNEIFFDKQVDKNEVANAILKRASRLLFDAEAKLKDTPENDKQALVKELIEELVKEQVAQARMLEDFKKIAENLNEQYADIYKQYEGIQHKNFKDDMMADESNKSGNKDDLDDYNDYLDIMRKIRYHPSTARSVNEAHEMIKEKEKIDRKFDSQRIEELLDEMYDLAKKLNEKNVVFYEYDAEDIYNFIDKLKRLSSLQEALEKKMDQIIYGEKSTGIESGATQSPPELILDKYQELVSLSSQNKKEFARLFKKEIDINQVDLDNIAKDILIKAKECLDNFKELVEKGEEINEPEILKRLEKYKTDLILTASIFKTLAARGDITLQDIKGVTYEQVTAAQMAFSPKIIAAMEKELKTSNNLAIPASAFKGAITGMIENLNSEEARSIDEIVQMLYIYGENYKHKPEFSDKLLPNFINKLKTGADKVRIYKILKDGQLIAFYRFDDQPDGSKYFGSFNVNPMMRGAKIGTALMEESLKKEGADCDIEADTDPDTLIGSKYIEDEGFVATAVIKNYGGSSDAVLTIRRNENNKRYYYRDSDYKNANIIKQYEKDFGGKNTKRPESKIIFKFAAPKEMIAEIAPLIDSGYAITRYFFADPKKDKTVYCALEKSSS